MRRQIIDYFGTRSLDGTSSLFPRGILRPWGDKLSTTSVLDLRTKQVPYFPRGIIHPWGDNSSTTSVLVLWRDKFPISQEDFLVHETTIDRLLRYSTFGGTSSLSLKKIFLVHETTIDRILRYSAFGGTSSLSPKRIFSSKRRQPIDYFGAPPSEGQASYLKKILRL